MNENPSQGVPSGQQPNAGQPNTGQPHGGQSTTGGFQHTPNQRPQSSGGPRPANVPGAPYYQAPQYARPGQPGAATRPVGGPPKTMSNSLALAAVGAILLIVAIGVGGAFSSDTHSAGFSILFSVGLSGIIAGCALGYSALRGERPGWFLGVTIAGAMLAFPVGIAGGGLLSQNQYYASDSAAESYSIEISGIDEMSETVPDDGMQSITTYSWDTPSIRVRGSMDNAVLDLRDAPEGKNLSYTISVMGGGSLEVWLNSGQVPLVSSNDPYADMGYFAAGTEVDYISWELLDQWSYSGNYSPQLIFNALGLGPNDPWSAIHFEFLSGGEPGQVVFVYREPDPIEQPQSGDSNSESSQSGGEGNSSSQDPNQSDTGSSGSDNE